MAIGYGFVHFPAVADLFEGPLDTDIVFSWNEIIECGSYKTLILVFILDGLVGSKSLRPSLIFALIEAGF